MDYKDDILVELSNGDLEELSNMYKVHKDKLPYLHSFLQGCIRSKKIGMSDYVTVLSPKNCWRDDGTFIALMTTNGHDVVMHSLDPPGKNLLEGLTKTQRFKLHQDPARNFILFYTLHELFYPKVVELFTKELKFDIFINELNVWCLEMEKGIELKNTLYSRDDVYVKELEPKDIPIINSNWSCRYPGSESKMLDWLKLGPGYGVYLKANNQLVSWVLLSCLGQLAAFQTLDEHQKKGYGRLALIELSRYLANKGFDPCGTIDIGNTASETLFGKLEFRKIHKCAYVGVPTKYFLYKK